MYIAVEGCAHGELDIIYEAIKESEKQTDKKIELLICCGDFQATRNLADLSCMAISDKYKEMGSFYKYYSGEKIAPILTIFIGGNHEASNHLQELSYGGWVAPNIYYLGYAGVVNIGGIRIAGMSGIYKGHDYFRGHYERVPYDNNSLRSVYHIRNLEVFRLKQLTGKIDIFISHDWPLNVTDYGDVESLLKIKPHFREQIERNDFGNPPAMDILKHHFPTYWFAAHMHCKFAAIVSEKNGQKQTKFLGLDKCLPRRKFLQVIEIENNKEDMDLKYDLEWLAVLYFTNHLLSVKKGRNYMPSNLESDRDAVHIPEDKEMIMKKFNNDLRIPKNFTKSAEVFNPDSHGKMERPKLSISEQTTQFCKTLGIDDPLALLKLMDPVQINENKSSTVDECNLNSDSSFERSFVSDNVIDSSETDCLPVVMDRVKESEQPVDFKSSLVPLKLPAVSNDSVGDEIVLTMTDETNKDEKMKEEKTKEESVQQIDDEQKKVEESGSTQSTKVFKRRNQSIYADTS